MAVSRGRPGRPLGDDRLGQRLQKIGLQPRQDRSTALFALATELPAALLARMLGVNIKVAVQWQQATGGDWAAHAADVSQRADDLPRGRLTRLREHKGYLFASLHEAEPAEPPY